MIVAWTILNTHLIFDWMTSLCWRGWVWYDGLRRSSSLVTRFRLFIIMTLSSSPGEQDLILLRQVSRALVTVEAGDVPRVDDRVHQVSELLWKWIVRNTLALASTDPGLRARWAGTPGTRHRALTWTPPRGCYFVLGHGSCICIRQHLVLTSEDDRVLGGAAAGEDWAGLALVRPRHRQRGGAVRGQRQSVKEMSLGHQDQDQESPGQNQQHSPGVARRHSPPALRPRLENIYKKLSRQDMCDDTHWKLSGVVRWLHDSHPLLQSHILTNTLFSLVTLA